jgi:putative CRISPR-associated protein (TIGR02619 family)
MKTTIITTVGTSLLPALPIPDDLLNLTYEDSLTEHNNQKSLNFSDKIEKATRGKSIENLSAEIQTVIKIRDMNPGKEFRVHLICTDTILSVICARLVKKVLEEAPQIETVFEENSNHIVKGLIVDGEHAVQSFSEIGFPNLIRIVREIELKSSPSNRPILNISGGYKALIPVMTIMGQLYEMEIVYMYEKSTELITLGKFPIEFDWGLVTEYSTVLQERDGRLVELKKQDNMDLLVELLDFGLVRKENDDYVITVVGSLFKEFAERESPLAMDVLGYYAELKLLEYYSANTYVSSDGKEFWRATTHIPSGLNDKDLDLIIYRNDKTDINGEFVTFECKTIKKIPQVIGQLRDQLRSFTSRKPVEHCLCLYADSRFRRPVDIESAIDFHHVELSKLKAEFEDSGISFSIKYFVIHRNNVPKNIKELKKTQPQKYANEFISLMREKITITDYKKI